MKIEDFPKYRTPLKGVVWIVRLAFYGLVTLFALVFFGGRGGPLLMAHRSEASLEMGAITMASKDYAKEYGMLPPASENYRLFAFLSGDNPRKIEFVSLKKSQMNANREMIDPWGTPFRITFVSDSEIHVVSAGPDKIFGTSDDIPNE